MAHGILRCLCQPLAEAAVSFLKRPLPQQPEALLDGGGRERRLRYLPQNLGDFLRLFLIFLPLCPLRQGDGSQIVRAFQKFPGLRPQYHRAVDTRLLHILDTEPAQGAAPAAFGIGLILGQELLINGQSLVKFPGSAQIISAVVGGGLLLAGASGKGHHRTAAGAGPQAALRKGGDIAAAVFAF